MPRSEPTLKLGPMPPPNTNVPGSRVRAEAFSAVSERAALTSSASTTLGKRGMIVSARNMVENRGQTAKVARRVATHATAMQRLERWMPGAVRSVVATLAKHGARGVLVGGGVRDAFLGRAAPDWDVATDAPPAQV